MAITVGDESFGKRLGCLDNKWVSGFQLVGPQLERLCGYFETKKNVPVGGSGRAAVAKKTIVARIHMAQDDYERILIFH